MCTVTISSARPSQVTNNVIDEIVVSGTISDCPPAGSSPPRVQVIVDSAVTVNGNTVGVSVAAVLQVLDNPLLTRPWSVTLKGISGVPCGTQIDITARCATDNSCEVSNTFVLGCDCPTIKLTKNDIDQRNCDENGNIEVIFTVELNNISVNGFFAGELHTGHFVNDNEFTYSVFFQEFDPQGQSLWVQQQNGQWQRTYTHHYPAGNFSNVYLSANLPPDCAGIYLVNDAYENGTVQTPVCPSQDCPDDLTFSVTRISSGDDVTNDVLNSVCLDPGHYEISVVSPNHSGDSFTWSLNNIVLSANITDDTDPNYPGVNGVNRSSYIHDVDDSTTALVTVSVNDGECVTPGSITLVGCGDVNGDCTETAWSTWSECNNCVQIRTRTLSDCSQDMETRRCTSRPTNWSAWNSTAYCVQFRTRMNENCQNEIQSRIDSCCVWMWVNIGLIALTAIVVLITFCMLPITIVAGAFTMGVLTAANIGLLIASASLATVSLTSLLFWFIFCIFLNPGSAACFLLNRFIEVMGFLTSISIAVGIALLVIAALCIFDVFCLFEAIGCASGAIIDVGWFGSILGVAVVVKFFLCSGDE